MKPWQDETISMRQRICWWLETHEKNFTTEDIRKLLNRPKPKGKPTDQVNSEISTLCQEGKLIRGKHKGCLRLYKKVKGLEFEELYPRVDLEPEAEKPIKFDVNKSPGIKGVITHGVNDKRVCA